MPVRVAVTAGITADCTQVAALIDGITVQFMFVDRGYGNNKIIDKAIEAGSEIVIPPKWNRKTARCYDTNLYREELGGKCFFHLKPVARYNYKKCKDARFV